MTAALFSAAVVTKFSALIILPIWLALGLIRIVQLEPIYSSILDPPKITGRWAKTASIAAIVMLGVTFAYLSIWLIYQLRFDAIVLQRGELPTEKLSLGSLSNFILSVARKYLLLPEALLFGLGDAYQRMERTAYLLGEISPNGFWLYFPVAFLVKTPVPTLLIIILAIVYQLTSRRPKVSGTHFLLVPVAVLFCFAIWSRLNVGWRHILPMYPLLFVWLGGMVSVMWRSERRSTRLVLYCLGVWLVTSTLMAYPNYLAYFNEAAGGSKNGRSILVDSNLDWGQDLKALKNWMTHNQIGKIQFAYFGTADPAYYKIDSVYLPGSVFVTDEGIHWHERPRYVAMSETLLAGLYLDKPDRYAQFRQREPVAIIGHSIRVFKLADEEQIE
jgi:hypothetical protein